MFRESPLLQVTLEVASNALQVTQQQIYVLFVNFILFFFLVAWILNFYFGKFLFKFIHFYSPIIWHSPPIKARANFTFCTFVWKDYAVMSIFHSK